MQLWSRPLDNAINQVPFIVVNVVASLKGLYWVYNPLSQEHQTHLYPCGCLRSFGLLTDSKWLTNSVFWHL
uniref:HDC10208 n=1 Tax=Drosophila melanogaster TaxID=7227 RepID=Q6IL69_DROME|nr:TPA_inf: HDC10208 [Drosophila melanogaster]